MSLHTRRRIAATACSFAVMLLSPPAHAADAGKAGAGLLQLLAVIVAVVAVGIGLGAFGHLVNNLFRRRAALTFEVIHRKPKLSLLTGVVVSLLGLGLIASLNGKGPLQLLVLLLYLGLLGTFALGAIARLAAQHLEMPLHGELPSARAHVKGSVLLLAINGVPLLGTLLLLGIMAAGVGAALLSYFAAFAVAPAPDAPPPAPPHA